VLSSIPKLCINNSMNLLFCQCCNASFIPKAGSLGKFCSLSCSSRHNNKLSTEKKISKYMLNPLACNCCNKSLAYEKRKNKFCSNRCAAIVSNKVERKRGPTPKEKLLYSKVKFYLCTHTNKWYVNRNPNGTVRRSSPYIKSEKEKYYAASRFKFNVYHFPNEFNLSLIETHGWYTCPGKKRSTFPKNLLGVSRDHIISVSYGFANNIDPAIISHPANCRIVLQSDNKKKHSTCDITLSELLQKIIIWDQKYSERRTGLEPVLF
jgi:hypothetical protein